ncbi:MAG: hypothetical protein LBE06_09040 [Azoarcus sp.]|nr:hypothetical protein [Azoarcus sp.]
MATRKTIRAIRQEWIATAFGPRWFITPATAEAEKNRAQIFFMMILLVL